MGKIILYHGSPNEKITPKFGLGDEKHDYGKGFYLTESLELAREWAVYRPDASNGWVHKFEIDTAGLNILDFLGGLGIQYCIKTEKAYKKIFEHVDALQPVSFSQFNEKYNRRDIEARENI